MSVSCGDTYHSSEVARPLLMRLPSPDAPRDLQYNMCDPDYMAERVRTIRTAHYSSGETLSREDVAVLLLLADDYLHLTTCACGQEHCVRKLRDIWRARRGREQSKEQ